MQEKILGTEKVSRLFIKFTIPAIIGMVFTSMQTIIDGIFVGQFVGENALASVNIARPFMEIIFTPTFIIAIGAMSYMGRCLGAKNHKEAQDIFKSSALLGLFFGLLIALAGWLFHGKISVFLGASPLLAPFVSAYIQVIALFAPFVIALYLFGFTARLMGRPEIYLRASILSVIINVSLDYLLVKQLQLGIQGAALATGIAYASAFAITLIPMLDKGNTINLFRGHWRPSVIGPMLYNGSSEGIVSVSSGLTLYLFNRTFMTYAGESGVAAYTSIGYMATFAIMAVYGINDGISSLISYNYGKQALDRVKYLMQLAIASSLVLGIGLVAALAFYAQPLVELFIHDNPTIVTFAAEGAHLYSISFLLVGYNIIYSGYFTALGNARSSIIIALCRGIFGIGLGLLILPKLLGIAGVWLAVPFAEMITLSLVQILKKRERASITQTQFDTNTSPI